MTFPGPTKNGTVRCPHCHHDTGQIPGKASVTWDKGDPMPPISFPVREHICGWCKGTVIIPGEAPDEKPPVTSTLIQGLDATAITMGNFATTLRDVTDALAQIPPAMIGPDTMTQNTGPPPHPPNCPGPHQVDAYGNVIVCDLGVNANSSSGPTSRPAAPRREPSRPTRELIFDDDDGWGDDE